MRKVRTPVKEFIKLEQLLPGFLQISSISLATASLFTHEVQTSNMKIRMHMNDEYLNRIAEGAFSPSRSKFMDPQPVQVLLNKTGERRKCRKYCQLIFF